MRRRGAFTLVELILVLTVLVIVAGAVWPALNVMMNNRGLQTGADQLRAAWTIARVEAVQTGQIYQFRCEPNGSKYQISIYSAQTYDETVSNISEAESDALGSGQAAPGSGTIGAGVPIGPQTLPEGVTFRAVVLDEDGRDSGAAGGSSSLADQSGLSTPVLFYPDGTTSSAKVAIADERELYKVVLIRGLTGVISVSDTLGAEELP